jgi:2-polyprenyl-6-methoxyphenol hydroxylase-like FAD-dependent oxidoreductase
MFGRNKHEADVVVIGAGPVGMLAALTLARRGVRVRIVDRGSGLAHSYALALHPGSLRVLAQLGLAQRLIGLGQRIERIVFHCDGARGGELDLAAVGGEYPFVLAIAQSALLRELDHALRESQVEVDWQHQVLDVLEAGDRVTVRVARMEPCSLGYPIAHTEWEVAEEFDLHPAYVVGADGYHSLVRTKLGLRYEDTGEAERFTVFEFVSSGELPQDMHVVFHADTVNVLWPLGSGRARWSFQARSPEDQPPTSETLERLLRERASWFDAPVDEVVWTTSVLFERRLASAFGRGRIWLAGDAAHITGPVGVQSMNVGLAEAHDLALRIATCLGGGASTLDEYGTRGQREWRTLLGLAGRSAPRAGAALWVREHAGRLGACIPAAGGDLERLSGQLGLQASAGHDR